MLSDIARDPEDTMLPWFNEVQAAFFMTGAFALVMLVWFGYLATEERIRRAGPADLEEPDGKQNASTFKRAYVRWSHSQVDFSAGWARFWRKAATVLLVVSVIGFLVGTFME